MFTIVAPMPCGDHHGLESVKGRMGVSEQFWPLCLKKRAISRDFWEAEAIAVDVSCFELTQFIDERTFPAGRAI